MVERVAASFMHTSIHRTAVLSERSFRTGDLGERRPGRRAERPRSILQFQGNRTTFRFRAELARGTRKRLETFSRFFADFRRRVVTGTGWDGFAGADLWIGLTATLVT